MSIGELKTVSEDEEVIADFLMNGNSVDSIINDTQEISGFIDSIQGAQKVLDEITNPSEALL